MRKSGSVSPLLCLTLYDTEFLCLWNSPGKNRRVGKPLPSPGDIPDPGIEPGTPALQADSSPLRYLGSPK